MALPFRSSLAGYVLCALLVPGAAPALADKRLPMAREIHADLTGETQVPFPGDVDGTGRFTGMVNRETRQLCYEIKVADISEATKAVLFVGDPGEQGTPLLELQPPAAGFSSGCVAIEDDLSEHLIMFPEFYFVNVMTAGYPGGAIRGQLAE